MINFFEINCQTKIGVAEFGIIDPDKKPAEISLSHPEKWIAIIDNSSSKIITFTAIDDCIEILREDGNKESRCDCMLTYDNDIDFIELKEVRSSWISGGIDQLKTTINLFSVDNDIKKYRRRRAFLANRLHPQFQHSRKEDMQRFKDETKVRLIIYNKIKI